MRYRTGLSSASGGGDDCRGGECSGAVDELDSGRALLHALSLDRALIISISMPVFMVSLLQVIQIVRS